MCHFLVWYLDLHEYLHSFVQLYRIQHTDLLGVANDPVRRLCERSFSVTDSDFSGQELRNGMLFSGGYCYS